MKGGLGPLQLRIVSILAREGHGMGYWRLVRALCGEREKKEDWVNDQCRIAVTKALRKLRRKGWVRRRKYMGEIVYTLTPEAKKLLLDLCPG